MPEFEIIFYKDSIGKCPVEEFLDNLDVKMMAKLEDGIFELRLDQISPESYISLLLVERLY